MLTRFIAFLDNRKSKKRKQIEAFMAASTDADQKAVSQNIDLFE
jgi:hypothetical protein